MGRIKRGLDYFPMNTDFIHDRMVRRIMKHEGDTAFVILVETFSYIYAGQGYYVTADEEFYSELADNLFSTDNDDVRRVISLAVEYGLFDAGLFNRHGILTSSDIQRQYLFIARRRCGSLILQEYCLLEAEEITSYQSSKSAKESFSPLEEADVKTNSADTEAETPDTVTTCTDSVTSKAEMSTSGTQNKRKQNKEKQNKTNNLPNPPQGGNKEAGEGENLLKKRKIITQEDIDRLQAPADETQRNFRGLIENLHFYKIPPAEQYAIILKSNFGAIGNPVWKGIGVIRDSNGKIRLPGHYLLSVMN